MVEEVLIITVERVNATHLGLTVKGWKAGGMQVSPMGNTDKGPGCSARIAPSMALSLKRVGRSAPLVTVWWEVGLLVSRCGGEIRVYGHFRVILGYSFNNIMVIPLYTSGGV